MDVLYPTRLPITHTGTSSRSYGWLFLFLSPLFNLIFLPIGQLSCNASCTSITRVASNRNLYPPFFTVSPTFGDWLPAGCNKKEVDRQNFSNPISITFCDDSAPFSCVCIYLIYLKKKGGQVFNFLIECRRTKRKPPLCCWLDSLRKKTETLLQSWIYLYVACLSTGPTISSCRVSSLFLKKHTTISFSGEGRWAICCLTCTVRVVFFLIDH